MSELGTVHKVTNGLAVAAFFCFVVNFAVKVYFQAKIPKLTCLTHFILTAKQFFPRFFFFIFQFLRPENDCYGKFASCSA